MHRDQQKESLQTRIRESEQKAWLKKYWPAILFVVLLNGLGAFFFVKNLGGDEDLITVSDKELALEYKYPNNYASIITQKDRGSVWPKFCFTSKNDENKHCITNMINISSHQKNLFRTDQGVILYWDFEKKST
jgi:hypothetical protein